MKQILIVLMLVTLYFPYSCAQLATQAPEKKEQTLQTPTTDTEQPTTPKKKKRRKKTVATTEEKKEESSVKEKPTPEPEKIQPKEPEPTPEPPVSTEPEGIDFDLPVIGKLTFYPYTKDGKDGLMAYFPAKGKTYTAGPLTIDEGQFIMIDDKYLYSARATLFGAAVRLGIKDVAKIDPKTGKEVVKKQEPTPSTETKKEDEPNKESPKKEHAESTKNEKNKKEAETFTRIRLGVDFITKPTLELLGKKAVLESADIVFQKNQPLQIIATTSVLNQVVEITFFVTKQATDAKVELKNLLMRDLIPPVRDTALENAVFASIAVTIKNFYTSKSPPAPKVRIFEGQADLTSTPGLSQSSELHNINVKGVSSDTEKTMQADIPSLTIPGFGTIKNAQLLVDVSPGKKSVSLQGQGAINIPSVGSYETDLKVQLTKQGITVGGTLKQDVEFAGVQIHNARIAFESATKTITIEGDSTIQGYKTTVSLVRDAKGEMSLKGAIKEKEIKPFHGVPVPGLSDIGLTNPVFSLSKGSKGYETSLQGIVTIFGVPMASTMHVARAASGKITTFIDSAAPAHWKLSQGISSFKGTLFDEVELNELRFIVSSNDYVDTQQNVTFKQGFNFIAKTKLSGPLAPAGQLTDTKADSDLSIIGYIAPNPMDSVFKAQIPNGVTIKKDNISVGRTELEIAARPTPSFALLTSLIIKPSSEDDPLTLTARIMFKPPSAALAGTMQGTWNNPLGIHGLELTDIAAEIAFNLITFQATHLPETIGLAATLGLGGKHVSMALKIPLGIGDLVIAGALDKLSFSDLTSLAAKMVGRELPFNKLPDFGLEDLKIYIVPKTTSIGELNFDRGLTLRSKIHISSFTAFGNLNVSQAGIMAQADCSEIHWGPLKVTGAKDAQKRGVEETGPIMRVALTLEKQQILVSGRVEIGDVLEEETFFIIDSSGIEFNFESGLGKTAYHGKPLLHAQLRGKSFGPLSNPNFSFLVDFEQNLKKYVEEQVKSGIQAAQEKVKHDINAAIDEVNTLKRIDAETQEKIKAAKQDVEKAKMKLKAIDDEINKARQEARDKISDKQAEVDRLDATIKDFEEKIQMEKDLCF